LHELAHDAAAGRWLATGGGGYQWARVVPRAWTVYFAEMAGREVPDAIPEAWRALAQEKAGHPVPGQLSEPDPPAGDGDEIDSVLEQIRQIFLKGSGPEDEARFRKDP
jgi:hypothetical protein